MKRYNMLVTAGNAAGAIKLLAHDGPVDATEIAVENPEQIGEHLYNAMVMARANGYDVHALHFTVEFEIAQPEPKCRMCKGGPVVGEDMCGRCLDKREQIRAGNY